MTVTRMSVNTVSILGLKMRNDDVHFIIMMRTMLLIIYMMILIYDVDNDAIIIVL